MSFIKTELICLFFVVLIGCDSADRTLVPNNHEGRVPDVVGLTGELDSSVVNKSTQIVRLTWGYDTVKYSTDMVKANLKNWEVYRIIGTDTIVVKFQLQRIVQIPKFADSSISIQPGGRDSVVLLYQVLPIGNVVDNIQFTGKPSDILRVVVHKK